MMDQQTKAVVLFSGGLDSILAARILQEQNISVKGLNIVTPFHDSQKEAEEEADRIGIDLEVRSLGDDYMAMLKNPRWGFGKGVNPCIDCRTAMLCAARRYMEEVNADFVATGEIVGQRPHSQMMHQLSLITRESGLGKKLLRPLSAKALPPTEPEENGLIDRERLYSCTGRGRSGLIALARRKYEVKRIPQPSTGCLLCEKSFAPRVRDMLAHTENPAVWDARLLMVGRHLRIDDQWKAVVARRQADGETLCELYADKNRRRSFLMIPENFNGPAVLMVNDGKEADVQERQVHLAGGLILRFDKPEKLAHLTTPPTALFHRGGTAQEIEIGPDETADRLVMIQEKLPAAGCSADEENRSGPCTESSDNVE